MRDFTDWITEERRRVERADAALRQITSSTEAGMSDERVQALDAMENDLVRQLGHVRAAKANAQRNPVPEDRDARIAALEEEGKYEEAMVLKGEILREMQARRGSL